MPHLRRPALRRYQELRADSARGLDIALQVVVLVIRYPVSDALDRKFVVRRWDRAVPVV